MTHTHSQGRGRAAFTMIELLIVVAIIAILVALMTGGVMRVLALGQRTEVTSDIMKMDQSLKIAMQKYNGITHLPGQLILFNDVSKYTTSLATVPAGDQALAKQTANVLRQMFGKRFLSNPDPAVNWGTGGTAGIKLQGHECLVFYLGGIPSTTGGNNRCLGFSANVRNPTAAGGERIGPFFEFRANRLAATANGFFQFNDPYGRPYAFFGTTAANTYANDCSSLGISPYFEAGTTTNYLNPNTFQIVSAGPNKAFGTGGSWNPKTGATDEATRDNLTNFSQSELGNEQQ